MDCMNLFRLIGLSVLLSLGIGVAPAAAATTGTLLPVSDGNYTQWIPKSGASHFAMVDETTCNGTTDYNSTTTVNHRDTYGLSLATIPDGSTITQIALTPCASKNTSGGPNSTMNVFYRLNGVDSANAGNYSVSGTTPASLSTTLFSGLTILKSPTTALQAGVVYTAGTRGLRVSRMASIITYTPLATPSGLVAVATGSAVGITWVDNSTNEDGFKIERSDNGGAYVEVGTVGQNIKIYSDPGLAVGTYAYRVRAYNAAANSAYTSVSTAYVISAPSSLAANTASGSVALSWVDNSSNEDGFRLERRLNGVGSFAFVKNLSSNVIITTDNNLPAGVYEYRIRAYKSTSASDYSNVDEATVLVSPTSLTATAIGSGSILLNWTDNAANEEGFSIERRNGTGAYAVVATTSANVTSYEDPGLTVGMTYHYRVRAFLGTETSSATATASATAF